MKLTDLADVRHIHRSISYYKKAAELGDKRAQQRLKGPLTPPPGSVVMRADSSDAKNNKDCVIM
jgi:hypothetical protein